MRALVITNGYLQPMLFGGMRQVVDDIRDNRPDDLSLLFARWRGYEAILEWIDALVATGKCISYNFIGYSYGVTTNAFVLRARPALPVDDFVSVDGVYRKKIHRVDPDSVNEDHQIDLVGTTIRRAHQIRQRNGILTGHELSLDPRTELTTDMLIEDEYRYPHLVIDQVRQVKELCVGMFT